MNKKYSRVKGITLIELLVAIVVGAIVLALGVGGFESIIAENRVAAAANDLLGSLDAARAEALRIHRAVVLCASSDETSCASTWNWNIGWVEGETAAPGVTGYSPTLTNISRTHKAIVGVDIHARLNGIFTGFDGYGFPLLPGRFYITDAKGGNAVTVCLTNSGAVYERNGNNFCN